MENTVPNPLLLAWMQAIQPQVMFDAGSSGVAGQVAAGLGALNAEAVPMAIPAAAAPIVSPVAREVFVAPKPTKANPDYDYDGYVSKYGKPDQSKGQHLTDEYKLPNHITFSTDSRYHSDENKGGIWTEGSKDKWTFTPSEFNLKNHNADAMAKYFHKYEKKGTFVKLPDGRLIEGTK